MADKRNIVIKVKYPTSGNATRNLAPKMITEWNVKRILLAVGVLMLMLASLYYFTNKDTQKTDLDNAAAIVNTIEKQATPQDEIKEAELKSMAVSKQTAAKANSSAKLKNESNNKNKQTADFTVKEIIKKTLNKNIKESEYSRINHNVQRASLTYGIKDKEPTNKVVGIMGVRHKKPVWVYYFTELKTIKDGRVYHEWLKDGVVISRQELVISANTWRASSRKLLSDDDKGNWAVRLVDKNGRLLNEKDFKVE